MKKLFAYFKHPTESIAKEDSASIKSLILFYILMQGIYLLVAIPFELAIDTPNLNLWETFKKNPFWFIALFPPIFEELTFRLPLKRSRINFMVSFVFIGWIASLFLTQHTLLGLFISTPVGLLLGYFLFEPLQKASFGVLFYVFAFLFGFLHISNYAGQITSFAVAIYVLIYLLNKVAFGMFAGYIRLRYSIFASIAVHFLNNFIPLSLAYIAYQQNML